MITGLVQMLSTVHAPVPYVAWSDHHRRRASDTSPDTPVARCPTTDPGGSRVPVALRAYGAGRHHRRRRRTAARHHRRPRPGVQGPGRRPVRRSAVRHQAGEDPGHRRRRRHLRRLLARRRPEPQAADGQGPDRPEQPVRRPDGPDRLRRRLVVHRHQRLARQAQREGQQLHGPELRPVPGLRDPAGDRRPGHVHAGRRHLEPDPPDRLRCEDRSADRGRQRRGHHGQGSRPSRARQPRLHLRPPRRGRRRRPQQRLRRRRLPQGPQHRRRPDRPPARRGDLTADVREGGLARRRHRRPRPHPHRRTRRQHPAGAWHVRDRPGQGHPARLGARRRQDHRHRAHGAAPRGRRHRPRLEPRSPS